MLSLCQACVNANYMPTEGESDMDSGSSANRQDAQQGWPDLNETQQNLFKDWFTSQKLKRQNNLLKSIEVAVLAAERFQHRSEVAQSAAKVAEIRLLQAQAAALEDVEHMRIEAWRFLCEEVHRFPAR